MQTDLLTKIDILIEMSKSASNIDTLKAELTEINEELEIKKKDLEDLKKSMQDEKYVKASDKIIDENIKVSLELKIRKLEASEKELEKEIKEALKKEEEAHLKQNRLQKKQEKLDSLSATLKEKSVTLQDSEAEIQEYYRNLINENARKITKNEIELKVATEDYRKISADLSNATTKMDELKAKIKMEKEKLSDTILNLSSNESYVDRELKAEDEQKVRDLEAKLDQLEERKDEIQNDAVMIGNEAKELLIEDDRTGCFLKVKELVDNLKKLPFMDIASSRELEQVLKEAEERAILERDEFASYIDSKKYDGNDSQIISEREKYLKRQKQKLEEELKKKEAQIKEIDTVKIRELSSLLSAATVVLENLKKELTEYKKVMDHANENLTPKKKATLTAAYNKKEEELESVQEIITNYEQEMEEMMKDSKMIAENDMAIMKEKIAYIDNDLKRMTKKSMISSKTKDVLAIENDKAKLKELQDRVKEIMERRKFKETPSEIYDEIEMSLGSFFDEKEENIKPIIEETESTLLNNFRISEEESIPDWNRSEKNKDILTEESTFIKEPKVIEENNFDFNDTIVSKEKNVIESNYNLEQEAGVLADQNMLKSLPIDELEEKEETQNSERLKVIKIEPLENHALEEVEQNKEAEVMIGDFKDEDYIDFDALLNGGNV
ncbi:MAG: hypothetical protein HFH86_04025 [Bacilli bacterium]|nr:hypothetical protein [Bacilli bacterium]